MVERGFTMYIVKWILIFVISVGVGTFIDVNILEKMDINIWLSRGLGCLATVIIALVMRHFFWKKIISK